MLTAISGRYRSEGVAKQIQLEKTNPRRAKLTNVCHQWQGERDVPSAMDFHGEDFELIMD
jgi:hypothetical protein